MVQYLREILMNICKYFCYKISSFRDIDVITKEQVPEVVSVSFVINLESVAAVILGGWYGGIYGVAIP